MKKEEFRFSPRPNRASEIKWRPWGEQAFAEALIEDKPVFLALIGSWCHWCHVMDETTYSDPEVIALLNEAYIPVRVDSDRRPDINERYNMGGWPTTAILTPRGQVIVGRTFVAPEQLKPILKEVARLWREKRKEFWRLNLQPPREAGETRPAAALDFSPYTRTIAALKRAYDPIYRGFGRGAKFPFPQALELALHAAQADQDEECLKVATETLMVMAGSGMYDIEEGGFYRYSATRNWAAPHYEKILRDNAALLFVYLRALQITGELSFADVARDILAYLENYLLNPDGTWGGSQDADREYYQLPYSERRRRVPPYVDRTPYTDQNGILIRALAHATWVLDEDQWQRRAVKTATVLWEKGYREGKGLAHYLDQGRAELFGRLTDQVAFGRACLALYSGTGDEVWLQRSLKVAEFCLKELWAPDGAFYDQKPDPGAIGNLAIPLKSIRDNAAVARWFLELSVLCGDRRYAAAAERALKALAPTFEREGLAGAEFALAVWEALHPWTCIVVVGEPKNPCTIKLHRKSLAIYAPAKTVRFIPANNTAVLEAAGLERRKEPYAIICRANECLPPLTDPADLVRALRPELH